MGLSASAVVEPQAAATANIRSCLFMNSSPIQHDGHPVNDGGAEAGVLMRGLQRGKENNYFRQTYRRYVGERESKQIYHDIRYSLGIPS